MITTVCASKSTPTLRCQQHTELSQRQKPLVNGLVFGGSNRHENGSCHHLLRMQGTSRHLRAIYGDRRIIWEDGRDLGAGAP